MIILANGKTNEVSQRTDATEALWVRINELPGATGWQMKPQGACLGELCVATAGETSVKSGSPTPTTGCGSATRTSRT